MASLPFDDLDPDFESGPPTTAEEYLRRVRWEAKKYPDVMSASTTETHPEDPRAQIFEEVNRRTSLAGDETQLSLRPDWIAAFEGWFCEQRARLRTQRSQVTQVANASTESSVEPVDWFSEDAPGPTRGDLFALDHASACQLLQDMEYRTVSGVESRSAELFAREWMVGPPVLYVSGSSF